MMLEWIALFKLGVRNVFILLSDQIPKHVSQSSGLYEREVHFVLQFQELQSGCWVGCTEEWQEDKDQHYYYHDHDDVAPFFLAKKRKLALKMHWKRNKCFFLWFVCVLDSDCYVLFTWDYILPMPLKKSSF